jgi:hypothetical protein
MISTKLDRVKRLTELEAENARLHKTAEDLAAYVRALQSALSSGAPRPRRPACFEGRREGHRSA